MSLQSHGRRAHARRLATASALGVAAVFAAAAPAHAAGPPQQFETQIEYTCEIVTPYLTVPGIQQFVTLKGTVPSTVGPGETFSLTQSSAKVTLPTLGSLAIQLVTDGQSTLNVLEVAGSNTAGSPVDLAASDVTSAVTPVNAGYPAAEFLFPATGTLPAKWLTAAGSAGSTIELRAGAVDHTLRAWSSTNPQIDQTLPFFCEPVAGSQPVTTISVVTSPTAPTITGLTPASGPASGGGTVTITGSNFEKFVFGSWTLLPQVRFGNTVSPGVTLVSPTELRAAIPAGTAGSTVDVTVATFNGISANTAADNYTYLAPTARATRRR